MTPLQNFASCPASRSFARRPRAKIVFFPHRVPQSFPFCAGLGAACALSFCGKTAFFPQNGAVTDWAAGSFPHGTPLRKGYFFPDAPYYIAHDTERHDVALPHTPLDEDVIP